MINRMKKKRIHNQLTLIFTAIILACLLIPMLAVAKYDVPAADDFSFSCETHAAVQNNEGINGIISGAASKSKDVYFTWQGTFSGIFMMALQPGIFGIDYYGATTWIMLLSLLGGIIFFSLRLYSDVFGAYKTTAAIIAIMTCIACTQFAPVPNQCFYWYNGSVYYTFTFGITLCAIAAGAGAALYGGKTRTALLAVMCIIIGGSNYVTALISCVLIVMISLFLVLLKNRRWKLFIIPGICLFISFAISAAAPGNAVRQGQFDNTPGIIGAILGSFSSCLRMMLKWSDLRLAAIVIFTLPFTWRSKCKIHAVYPGMISAFSFCLLSAMFTPQLYALGTDAPGRILDIIYFAYVIMLEINIFYWCTWLRQKKSIIDSTENSTILLITAAAAGISLVCLLSAVAISGKPIVSIAALSELRSGEAKGYYMQALERQKELENPDVSECIFEPFRATPYLLYFADMTDDINDYTNADTATYYGKSQILIK